MTSISQLTAGCPHCGSDILEEVITEGPPGIGDGEDILHFDCPVCTVELEVELLAGFRVSQLGPING